ncbi:hypothetical protein BV898_03715 [Hypsibius exemplaris]|uniref:Uncharacterized protein n=1 Tax=Hypsibius exemplaris TaxID=2072580 RepID=A0A1W0X408_HYPEX|nr:hypothetical protein BV898_03715 [Hypsibius exemplaris]
MNESTAGNKTAMGERILDNLAAPPDEHERIVVKAKTVRERDNGVVINTDASSIADFGIHLRLCGKTLVVLKNHNFLTVGDLRVLEREDLGMPLRDLTIIKVFLFPELPKDLRAVT